MQIVFTKQFVKQVSKTNDKQLAREVETLILEVKNATDLSEINGLKQLKGSIKAYRIRLGDYRIGIYNTNDIIEFSCFMHRKEIYRYFP